MGLFDRITSVSRKKETTESTEPKPEKSHISSNDLISNSETENREGFFAQRVGRNLITNLNWSIIIKSSPRFMRHTMINGI
jgi:hypothetical protein